MDNKTLQDRIFSEKTAFSAIIGGIIVFIISVIVYITNGSWEFSLTENIKEDTIGQFGDFIGGVIGSLFSLVGVILFYVALKDQRKDFLINQETLKSQNDAFQQQIIEFQAQREELEHTRKIYEQQHKTMMNQQFDSNFYSLLNVFLEQRNQLNNKGRNGFFEHLLKKLELELGEHNLVEFNEVFLTVQKSYLSIYGYNRAKLALYYMTLYRLFKVIENCHHLTHEERLSYHKILRSLITKDELLILYYNYHSSFGTKPLPIITKYNYFKHLETLSKIEFKMLFNISPDFYVDANNIIDKVRNLLFSNIELAKQIENENKVEEVIILMNNVYLQISIDPEIEIKLIIQTNTKLLNLHKDLFVKFIESVLIDLLYFSNFKKFQKSLLNKETKDKDNYIFTFINYS